MPREITPPAGSLGAAIRTRRHAAELSQDALAEAAGISQSHLSALETGGVEPSMAVLRRLAASLGCEARDLV